MRNAKPKGLGIGLLAKAGTKGVEGGNEDPSVSLLRWIDSVGSLLSVPISAPEKLVKVPKISFRNICRNKKPRKTRMGKNTYLTKEGSEIVDERNVEERPQTRGMLFAREGSDVVWNFSTI
ncbi:hypothetical protein E2542_SST17023 [Spatholobus suberectus]|nr:hypothetical protein E2542_SST17023 [Spatholobus suberectus]